jgi:hypothetical protein
VERYLVEIRDSHVGHYPPEEHVSLVVNSAAHTLDLAAHAAINIRFSELGGQYFCVPFLDTMNASLIVDYCDRLRFCSSLMVRSSATYSIDHKSSTLWMKP